MPSYDTLDAIAGCYDPLLAVVALATLAWLFVRGDRQQARTAFACLVGVVIVVYAFMGIDRAIRMSGWSGVHYSTHSAFAIALSAFVSAYLPRSRIPIGISLFAYFVLIVYQGYHSTGDVVLTLILVAPLAVWIARKSLSKFAANKPALAQTVD